MAKSVSHYCMSKVTLSFLFVDPSKESQIFGCCCNFVKNREGRGTERLLQGKSLITVICPDTFWNYCSNILDFLLYIFHYQFLVGVAINLQAWANFWRAPCLFLQASKVSYEKIKKDMLFYGALRPIKIKGIILWDLLSWVTTAV